MVMIQRAYFEVQVLYLFALQNFLFPKTECNYQKQFTDGPRNLQSFYLQIRLFSNKTLVYNAYFLIKMCLFYLQIWYSRS
jgi:hypothetical protein